MPLTSSTIAVGWSPLGVSSETIFSGTPPSDFSGRGGRCGTQVLSRNSGLPLSISADSASTVAGNGVLRQGADVLEVDIKAGDRIEADGGALLGRAEPAHGGSARRLVGPRGRV